ncbi:MAG: LrgB family protein, partial [Bradyrhizobium sp.]|nr:LrgB family protein [Bradyrhizobium sp.]
MTLAALWREPLVQAAVWSLATILLYLLAKRVHRRWPRWWLMPLAVAPALLMIAALALNVSYRDYIR